MSIRTHFAITSSQVPGVGRLAGKPYLPLVRVAITEALARFRDVPIEHEAHATLGLLPAPVEPDPADADLVVHDSHLRASRDRRVVLLLAVHPVLRELDEGAGGGDGVLGEIGADR